MKKIIIPLTFAALVLLSAGTLYGMASRHFANNPDFSFQTDDRELSLAEVKKTNIQIQPDVTYTVKYEVQTMTEAHGFKIHSKKDTTSIWLLATGDEETKPVLPHKDFSWGTLRLR